MASDAKARMKALTLVPGSGRSRVWERRGQLLAGAPGAGWGRNQDTAGKNARGHTARRQTALSSNPTHVAH